METKDKEEVNKKPLWLSTFHSFKNGIEAKVSIIYKIVVGLCIVNLLWIIGLIIYHLTK